MDDSGKESQKALGQFDKRFLQSLQALNQRIAKSIPTFRLPALDRIASIDWAAAQKKMDEFPQRSKEAMDVASAKGWFFAWTGSLRETYIVTDHLKSIDEEQVNEYMADHYRSRMDCLSEDLTKKFPARAVAISAAVRAHQRADKDSYTLSIPVFIAQADGMISEILGAVSALQKVDRTLMEQGAKKGETRAAHALRNKVADEEDLNYVNPILTLHNLDFLMSQRDRASTQSSGGEFSALNRHQVMHGEVSDYGTELNSLRAFSFLCFVGLHLPAFLNWKVQDNA
ncbi:hypothetical protein [Pseudomonas cucumis]|uniref:hypothetical protein n=1 Tax=Pseudomonas cucumis TaxID=2954082 RepID=UPI002734B0E1|nr:hypothetical protein [Pseudomonas cucumis]WLG91591.1 hypothetical protein PSH72_05735 [Pseudomonas cucumis]